MWSASKSNNSPIDVDPLLTNVFEQITPLIQKDPLLSVLFLEHLANFAGGQIDQLVSFKFVLQAWNVFENQK